MARPGHTFAQIDVGYLQDARILEAGADWQLHFAAVLASKSLLLDGELSRRQLARIAPESVPDVARAIDHLIEVGLFIDKGDAIAIHAWSNWNDSARDVELMATGGEKGNHLRWHVRRHVVKDGCSYCLNRGESGGDSLPDREGESHTQIRHRSDVDTDPTPLPFERDLPAPPRAVRSKKAAPNNDPLTRQASELTELAFRQPRTPTKTKAQVRLMFRKELAAGQPFSDVEHAITHGIAVWSQAGIETTMAMAKRANGSANGAVSYSAPAVSHT